ncbi:DUF4062 domain-containing protein [Aggregatilinea lenta]|uniref:DUF4062 domain-containing protein n=1 Tax=Aggregatilinea lenta TaxID=913108 RepID=UPI000E5BBBE3|nr:DUF4062 domain-containing protein [Aggregatilinea lenta]
MAEKPVVFISSTSMDLPDYRRAVFDAVEDMGFSPDAMEHWPAADENSVDFCRRKVEEADIYIGIFAHRYGWRPGGLGTPSITEMEYDWATARGIPRFCFIVERKFRWELDDIETEAITDLNAFKERLQSQHKVRFFNTSDDLKAKVVQALAYYVHSVHTEKPKNWGPISYEQHTSSSDSASTETIALNEQSPADSSASSPPDDVPSPDPDRFIDRVLAYTQRPAGLLYFREWDMLPDTHSELTFQYDSNRDEFIQAFASLNPADGIAGIRLLGAPGTGKSRLALETMRQLALQPGVIYAQSPSSVPTNLFNSLALSDTEQIVLVVDNCSYADTRQLCRAILPCKDKVNLLTIETYHNDLALDTDFPVHVLNFLANDGRRKIVQQIYDTYASSTFNDDKAAYYEETVGVNLKLLVAYVMAFHRHPQIRGLAELSRTEEMNHLLAINTPVDHSELRVLQGLALANRTGLYQTVRHDAHVVAEFIGLSYAEFKQSAESLRQKGLIIDTDWYQRDAHHRLVVPRLFAVHLAMQIWTARGDDVMESLLEGQNTGSRSLRLGILERLADLGHRGIAFPVVSTLLNRFRTFDDLAGDAETFRLLGEADPLAAVNHLDRLMQGVSLNRLREFRDGRRYIIPLLTSLLRLEETFWTAANLVGRYTAAENETLGNNATETWRSLFFIRSGGNPVNGLDRLRLIRDYLDMQEPEMRVAAVKALEGALDNHEGGMVTRGPGGYITPSTWRPATWGEFWDIRRAAWQVLGRSLSDTDNEVITTASDCILKYASHQIPVLLDEVLEQLRALSQRPGYRLRVWKTLQEFVNLRNKDLTQEHFASIQELADILVTDSYHDQLEIYVADFDIFARGKRGALDETKEFLAQKLGELAKQGYENEALLEAELDWLVTLQPWQKASQIYSFIYELSRLDRAHRWIDKLIERVHEQWQLHLIAAYMRGQLVEDETEWVRIQVIGWTETNELLASSILILPEIATEEDEISGILHRLLDRNWIELMDLAEHKLDTFCANALSTEAMKSLLNRVLEGASPEGIYVGTAYLFQRLHDNHDEAPEYADIAFQLMTGSAGEYSSFGLFDWYREELENLYVTEYPREVASIILRDFKQSDGYIFDFMNEHDTTYKMLVEAIRSNPQVALDVLNRTLLPEEHPDHISRYRFPGLHINLCASPDMLLDWATQHQPDGPQSLAEMCFVGNIPLDETVRGLIVQCSQDEQVWDRLADKYTQLEMMEVSQIPTKLRELRDLARVWLEDEHFQVRQWTQGIIYDLEKRLLEREF